VPYRVIVSFRRGVEDSVELSSFCAARRAVREVQARLQREEGAVRAPDGEDIFVTLVRTESPFGRVLLFRRYRIKGKEGWL